jgi:hypothetical protein
MMIIIQIVLWFFFIGCSVTNWSVLTRWLLHNKPGSTLPLMGGIAGAFAMANSDIEFIKNYWALSFVVDASYILYFIGIFKYLGQKIFTGK